MVVANYTPEDCNLQMVVSNLILVVKKQHASNGCKMSLLRSPVQGSPFRLFWGSVRVFRA